MTLNWEELARGYLQEAELRFQTAKEALQRKHWAFAVRQSQETVELALKAALR